MTKIPKIALLLIAFASCSGDNDPIVTVPTPTPTKSYNYLALGDSYTIGESVCQTCRFPEQLKTALQSKVPNSLIKVDVIAQTGWTTANLMTAIANENPSNNYDLVTLLIGVNNQYQHKPFALYESEFPTLVNQAIAFAKGDKSNVIVISIPDYAYTPFGQNSADPSAISTQIDQYNAFAEQYCNAHDIVFVNITDITRNGLENPELVASDGLHPSQIAYAQFVQRLLPKAKTAILP